MKKYSLHMLVLLNVILVLVLARLWFNSAGHLRNIQWQVPKPQTVDYAAMVPSLPGVAPADTSQFIAMLDRPVFSPTRRPPPPPPPPQEKEPVDNLTTAQLSGLFRGGQDGGVIIQIAGKHRRVRLNENVEGWLLSDIQDRSVTFTRSGQSRVLQLPRAAVTTYTGLPPSAGMLPAPARAVQAPASALPAVPGASTPSPQSSRGGGRQLQPVFGGSAAN